MSICTRAFPLLDYGICLITVPLITVPLITLPLITVMGIIMLLTQPAQADIYHFPPLAQSDRTPSLATPKADPDQLVLYSATDIDILRPLLQAFQSLHPYTALTYHELQSQKLFEKIKTAMDQGQLTADIAISSAMDLQMKLANDGYAMKVNLPNIDGIPEWAVWRQEAFGFSIEPAVIIYHKPSFGQYKLPVNRHQLTEFLRQNGKRFLGRIATYDIQKSGLGFLFLARDLDQYGTIWSLIRQFGVLNADLYTSSAQMIEDVAAGKHLLAYNVLGSYALSALEKSPDLGILLPEDYTLAISRIALIPKAAQNPQAGKLFLHFLLSETGQALLSQKGFFDITDPDIPALFTQHQLRPPQLAFLRPIKVGPGLLAYLDRLKRRKILSQWQTALEPHLP